MPETYGYIRTSRPRVSELSGSDPETPCQHLMAAGVAFSGLRAGPRRNPGCGVHRPHRAALAGHYGQHPRLATARGEDSQLSR